MDVNEVIKKLEEFDWSDDYHDTQRDSQPNEYAAYYAAIGRAIALLRGDITDWTSPPKSAAFYSPNSGDWAGH